MTHDTGFAPNPFHSVLTLATCKPGIRRTKDVGDWVAGFASKALVKNSKALGVKINYQGLVYLMRIGEVLPLEEYFVAPQFQRKKPLSKKNVNNFHDPVKDSGDNIYYRDNSGMFQQMENENHPNVPRTIMHDTNGKNVLIADKFYYFGRDCPVPDGGWKNISFRVPVGPTCNGYESDEVALHNILHFLRSKKYELGIHGNPCHWDEKKMNPLVAVAVRNNF